MPDRRRHRGAHPEDVESFAVSRHAALRRAVEELSWLWTRGYAPTSSLKLVGDRHDLTARQRLAVSRCACGDEALKNRLHHRVASSLAHDQPLAIDGYNVLITLESALAGGLILIGLDGCRRDLASVHGTYRKVEETRPALEMTARFLKERRLEPVHWVLDRPVSNSGRLKGIMLGVARAHGVEWSVELLDNPDRALVEREEAVATSDSWILDHCGRWFNVVAELIPLQAPGAWMFDSRPV